MPHIIDWQSVADRHEVARQAVGALLEGKIVAFPTETVYGLAAFGALPEAVERLCVSKGRPVEKPLSVAIAAAEDLLHWVPDAGTVGRRLARRSWPGPLTLVFRADPERGLVSRMPAQVRSRVCPAGTIGLRVPAHEAILEVLYLLPGPMILTSANRSGEPAAITGTDALAAVGDDVELLIDDGPARFGKASTVVKFDGDDWQVLREGVLTAEVLRRRAACMIVFICTGNTCRSPMAEALCKRMLAERLGCGIGELTKRGYVVLSVGLAADAGAGAAPEAQDAVAEMGADLSCHRSTPASWELLCQADHILAMTHNHLQALLDCGTELHDRVRLLSPLDQDIADPLGQDRQVYRECAREIHEALQHRLAELTS
jgi:protein-tyrosine phosphatase